MANPITYWVQTPAIDKLCELYGSNLERLSREETMYLLNCLTEVLWEQLNLWDSCPQPAEDAWKLICQEDTKTYLSLIEAIAAQLNAQSQQKGEPATPPSALL